MVELAFGKFNLCVGFGQMRKVARTIGRRRLQK
jgi:hypothetical protein